MRISGIDNGRMEHWITSVTENSQFTIYTRKTSLKRKNSCSFWFSFFAAAKFHTYVHLTEIFECFYWYVTRSPQFYLLSNWILLAIPSQRRGSKTVHCSCPSVLRGPCIVFLCRSCAWLFCRRFRDANAHDLTLWTTPLNSWLGKIGECVVSYLMPFKWCHNLCYLGVQTAQMVCI